MIRLRSTCESKALWGVPDAITHGSPTGFLGVGLRMSWRYIVPVEYGLGRVTESIQTILKLLKEYIVIFSQTNNIEIRCTGTLRVGVCGVGGDLPEPYGFRTVCSVSSTDCSVQLHVVWKDLTRETF